MADYDIAVIGGGIHGCGIARDAAGRGLSVLLVEQGDLASATSSASTKLIHGGLRYLEHFAFRLVRECLVERELLLKLAPHLVYPLRLVLPQVPGMRPAFMLKIGLKLYDWIGGASVLPRSRVLDLADDPAGAPLKRGFNTGFEFSDCSTDDARLVVANAIGAREKRAVVRTRTRCAAARREDGRWKLVLQTEGQRESVTARGLVNAAGPWAGHFVENVARRPLKTRLKLVKGSHIVVPRLQAHDRGYLLQNFDERVIFAVPFADAFTLIGTTEIAVSGDPAEVAAEHRGNSLSVPRGRRLFPRRRRAVADRVEFRRRPGAGGRRLDAGFRHRARLQDRDRRGLWRSAAGLYFRREAHDLSARRRQCGR